MNDYTIRLEEKKDYREVVSLCDRKRSHRDFFIVVKI